MPEETSQYLVGLDDWRHATDIRAFAAETGELLEILHVYDLGPVVAYRVVVDAPPGTEIDHQLEQLDIRGHTSNWTPPVRDVTMVPEPGTPWSLAVCVVMLLALILRRRRS